MQDELILRRKRLLYRSLHRGTKELDLLLGTFAERHVGTFDADQLDRYEAILESDEQDIYDWIAGRQPVPERHDHDVMRLLLAAPPPTRP